MHEDAEMVKDLLLEDYRHQAELFRSSEQAGETRVNMFLGLVTLVVGGLFALQTGEHSMDSDRFNPVALFALTVLLAIGFVTMLRLIVRNHRTDECKSSLDRIRQTFKDNVAGCGLLHGYTPIIAPLRPMDPKSTLSRSLQWLGGRSSTDQHSRNVFSGLTDFVVVVNSFLAAALVFLALHSFLGLMISCSQALTAKTIADPQLLLLALAAGSALIAWVGSLRLQSAYVRSRHREHDAWLVQQEPTHAGGVVFRNEGGSLRYLIVRSSDKTTDHWVLPKGHIERGEEPGIAALREVAEEIGVCARLIQPLSVTRFKAQGEQVLMKCFLMESLGELPGAGQEGRELLWGPFDVVYQHLTFEEAQQLLRMAHVFLQPKFVG